MHTIQWLRNNKAILLTHADELVEVMGWSTKKTKPKKQREFFIEMTPDEKTVVHILQQKETVHIDEINMQCGLSSSAVAAALLNLELQSLVANLPGKMYRLM